MTQNPGERIVIPSAPNLRDLGGWPTRDGGRVRCGLLYRSVELNKLHGDDMAAFARLGIRSIYDLRTEAERAKQSDRLPDGAEHILARSNSTSPLGWASTSAPSKRCAVCSSSEGDETMAENKR